MSVYKSRRKDAAAEFVALARKLRVETIQAVKKFPTSYRWIITNNLLALAGEVYTNAVKANAIYLHKDLSLHDFELRHRYMKVAISSAEALLAEITFCYEMVDEGNNFFEGKVSGTWENGVILDTAAGTIKTATRETAEVGKGAVYAVRPEKMV